MLSKRLGGNASRHSDLLPGTVKLVAVTKRFRKHTVAKRSYSTVKTTLIERFFRARYPRQNFLTALDDVSFEVKPGAAIGIIGRNGSGKSTLLKLIAGIYRPDAGEVCVRGKISALIELGAGFHPDFSGRENVFLGGIMYGLTRQEIEKRFDSIVAYAQLEEFIDDPVRTYSSGMYMRLGFSLAVHTDPDILLVDEVLAVGDAAFIHRCQETISNFKKRGKTLVFVTHDLDSVSRWCDEAIWLKNGRIVEQGEPVRVIDSYLAAVEKEEAEDLALTQDGSHGRTAGKNRWGNGAVEITSVRMLDAHGNPTWMFHQDDAATIEVAYEIRATLDELVFGVGILRVDGLCIHGTNTAIDNVEVPLPTAGSHGVHTLNGTYRYRIERLSLTEGTYFLDVAAHSAEGVPYDYHHELYKFSVRNVSHVQGVLDPAHEWQIDAQYPVAVRDRNERKVAQG